MPPKASKKEVQKKQKAVIDDKTFGLKNKNKSKVVQNFVKEVTANAKRAGLSKDEAIKQEKARAERSAQKEEKKARENELNFLFAPAMTKKQKEQAEAKKKAAEEAAKKAAEEGPEIVDSQEAYAEAKRAEDLSKAEAVLGEQQDDDLYVQIEKERAELKKKGGLTPVTFDSFVEWKKRKDEERKKSDIEDAKRALAAASKLKGRSGRELFAQLAAQNADLFLDDDEADDDWMVREEEDDDEEVYDIHVTGTSFSLQKAGAKEGGQPNAQAEGEAAAEDDMEAGAPEPKDDGAALAAGVDAALFLDDDVDLPSDDDDDDE
mmetsp:Transcript_42918/g.86086  ORF Transcript_42918/g.86086 Transcript_42918/m.86086 type:complete len:320 (-) Transcript_42918:44-1003(-)|eukprot:CAMPEP_0196760658 /NCGR_PEP_ID=MMETSP1091-20130531/105343_1 /TAXON_ID=302021 /ORGANISM="Rhodomonas sp., Strain CCMP768" /LENGTH=319 /DNA_ID=CAMNT_0042109571 /DNA_START=75 /DNA_END=1034 /DNA_ORIENTATION=-